MGGDTGAAAGAPRRDSGRLHVDGVADGDADRAARVHGDGAGRDAHVRAGQHCDAFAGDDRKRQFVGSDGEHDDDVRIRMDVLD